MSTNAAKAAGPSPCSRTWDSDGHELRGTRPAWDSRSAATASASPIRMPRLGSTASSADHHERIGTRRCSSRTIVDRGQLHGDRDRPGERGNLSERARAREERGREHSPTAPTSIAPFSDRIEARMQRPRREHVPAARAGTRPSGCRTRSARPTAGTTHRSRDDDRKPPPPSIAPWFPGRRGQGRTAGGAAGRTWPPPPGRAPATASSVSEREQREHGQHCDQSVIGVHHQRQQRERTRGPHAHPSASPSRRPRSPLRRRRPSSTRPAIVTRSKNSAAACAEAR